MRTWGKPGRRRWALALAIAALTAAACGGGGGGFNDARLQEFDDPLTTPGQAHFPNGRAIPYTTIPPYGGPHWTIPLRCGIYDAEQYFEPLVHTMEHGAVILYYQPLVFRGDEVAEFRVLASRLLQEGRRFALAPSTQIGDPLVLASWGRLLAMDRFEPGTIEAFLDAFEGDAPEDLRCD